MQNQQQKRIASDTYLAFEYQWDFFVLEVLKLLDEDTTLYFEYLDDVARKHNDNVILYQVKHSIRKKSNGKTINLTSRDCDLWKTISVWMKFIEDNDESQQDKYIMSNEYILITNKTTDNNSFIEALSEYKQNQDIELFRKKMSTIRNAGRISSETTNLIRDFINAPYLEKFVMRINTNCTPDELEPIIKKTIGFRFALKQTKINDVYEHLMTRMRDDAKNAIRNHQVVQYTCHTIQELYWSIIQEGREKLVFRTDYPCYTGNPRDLLFIRQLLAVNAIDNKDCDDIVNYTNEWFQFHNNLKDKWNEHEINDKDIQNLTTDVNAIWRNSHKQSYRKLSPTSSISELDDAANNVLASVREAQLTIASTPMGRALSNGCFYYYSNDDASIVSNMPRIGWHINWKDKFIKHE